MLLNALTREYSSVTYKIHQWQEIASKYHRGALLLGNGASMAISGNFGYKNLFSHARQNFLLDKDVQTVFDYFKTDDFELVLRLVWQAAQVNKALSIQDMRTYDAYVSVRESLIKAVRDIHPAYEQVSMHLPHMQNFMKEFNTVFSLNYDLLVYWAMMYSSDTWTIHKFKDCFNRGVFAENWREYRNSWGEQSNTLVFYPHGNLALHRDLTGQEYKINAGGNALLKEILNIWRLENSVPLFVSEGTCHQKIRSISNSGYLSKVFREVLRTPRINLTIYGWAMGKQDLHILESLKGTSINNIAVSVYNNSQDYCHDAYQAIQKYVNNVSVQFFDCNSPGCWIHPPQPKQWWD